MEFVFLKYEIAFSYKVRFIFIVIVNLVIFNKDIIIKCFITLIYIFTSFLCSNTRNYCCICAYESMNTEKDGQPKELKFQLDK